MNERYIVLHHVLGARVPVVVSEIGNFVKQEDHTVINMKDGDYHAVRESEDEIEAMITRSGCGRDHDLGEYLQGHRAVQALEKLASRRFHHDVMDCRLIREMLEELERDQGLSEHVRTALHHARGHVGALKRAFEFFRDGHEVEYEREAEMLRHRMPLLAEAVYNLLGAIQRGEDAELIHQAVVSCNRARGDNMEEHDNEKHGA